VSRNKLVAASATVVPALAVLGVMALGVLVGVWIDALRRPALCLAASRRVTAFKVCTTASEPFVCMASPESATQFLLDEAYIKEYCKT
jgi:hypothetical protein